MTITVNCNALATTYEFSKRNPNVVAFTKTGNFSVSSASRILVSTASQVIDIPASTVITMPTPVTGTDYAIWANTNSTLQATDNFVTAPATNSRLIGGFHYAPGSNASAQAGGNTTPQINEYSFWDLKFRPACTDPRGMTLVAGNFWSDIYLTGVDAITNGSSKYNVTIADGSSPPKVPAMFGGNGSTTYGSYTWFEAQELATAFGKYCMTQQQFMVATYGTTEATSSGGSDVPTTGVSGSGATSAWNVFTSKWGLVQSTGCLYIWGRDRGGPTSNTTTESRGTEKTAPNASLFGGVWYGSSLSGSRCSYWSYTASYSYYFLGSRFVCDHLILVA